MRSGIGVTETSVGTGLRPGLLLGIFLLASVLYSTWFIVASSFVIDGTRWFCLADDMMISLRYARNLATGHGWCWNPNETPPVEGVTNPGWTLILAGMHGLGLPPEHISLAVQILGAVLLLLQVVLLWRLGRCLAPDSVFVAGGAALLLVGHFHSTFWALTGWETPLLGVVMIAVVLQFARAPSGGRIGPSVWFLLGLGVLVRIDVSVVFAALIAFVGWRRRYGGPAAALDPDWRWGVVVLLLCVGGQTVWRWWVFGELLPNTYYLKMTGYPVELRITRGLSVLANFTWYLNPLFVALAVAVPWWLRPLARGGNDDAVVHDPPPVAVHETGSPVPALALWMFAICCTYSIYVGGDAWDWWGGSNRFITPAMPLYFLLLAQGLDLIRRRWLPRLAAGAPVLARFGMHGVLMLALLQINAFHGTAAWRVWWGFDPVLHLDDHPGMVRCALTLSRLTRPEATVAVVWAGIIPYITDRRSIDLLGKNDPVIARLPMHRVDGPLRYTAFWPGHLKWDYSWSIGRLRPDVVVGRWLQPETAAPFLRDYETVRVAGIEVFCRRDSPHLDRAVLAELAAQP